MSRLITSPQTRASKSKILQFYNVKTGNQLALKLLQSGVDLLSTQQLNIKNPKLIKQKQIENAYMFAMDTFNTDLLQKRQLKKEEAKKKRRKPKMVILPSGSPWINYKTIKNLKKPVLINILEKGVLTRSFTLDAGDWSEYILKIQVKSDEFLTERDGVEIQMIEATKPKKTKPVTQTFKDGKFNCVLEPIKIYIEDKMQSSKATKTINNYKTRLNKVLQLNEKYFDQGVQQTGLDDIANTLQINLTINLPFQGEFLTAKSNKKALRTFKYMNTRLHHVEYDEVSYSENRVVMDNNELIKLQKKLDKSKQYYTYSRNTSISEIRTTDTIYCLANEYNEAVNQFEIDTGIINYKIDSITNKEVVHFIRQGVHFNETIDFNTSQWKKTDSHIDMEKAYANFKLCKYYTGFLGKITDFRKCDTIQGIGFYRICNLKFNNSVLKKWNEQMNIYEDGMVFPSPELEMLRDKGATFNVDLGCWGGQFDFEFNDTMKNGKSVQVVGSDIIETRFYCKWVGQTFCNNESKSFFIKGDKDFIGMLQNELNADTISVYDKEVRVSYKKQHNSILPHIAGFITSYMRMNVLEQLEEFQVSDICKIVCDGIYFKTPTEGSVALKNCFRYESKEMTKNTAGDSYISNREIAEFGGYGEPRIHNMVELHTGAGGCGKTHYNLTDKGLVGVSFYAPTWKLARSKQTEYACKSTTIAKISTTDVNVFGSQYRYANVLVVDEVSMMSEEVKQQILKNMNGCKIIFCGDIGYQLPPFDPNKPVKEFKKDLVEIKHIVNHRVECGELATILSTCRKMMDEKKNIMNYVLKHIPCKNVPEYNHLTDMILATTHNVKNEYTEKYKDKLKLVITKSDEVYGCGEVYYDTPNTEHYENRHGYTVHSIQGETMRGNIFIDMRGVYENRMIYTMISRAKRLEQIVILKGMPL